MNQESGAQPEFHLFIVWEAARGQEATILADLAQRFELVSMIDIRWSAEYVSANFSRFYGQKLPQGSFKEEHCGTGPFLAVVVKDDQPDYQWRETSKGPRRVNSRTFDAKQTYRDWTGGGHRIHATDTEDETRHDIALLLGISLSDYVAGLASFGQRSRLTQDLAGAAGWRSLRQLFSVLNEAIPYVVVRNYEWLPDQYSTAAHGDIDLLTSSAEEMAYVCNAQKVFPEKLRVHYSVAIGDESVLFDFRYVGDEYYDHSWQQAILNERVLHEGGFYIPDSENYFYSLLYHALIHKREIAADYAERLAQQASELRLSGLNRLALKDAHQAARQLQRYLSEKNYTFTRPLDRSVYFNEAVVKSARGLSAEGAYRAAARAEVVAAEQTLLGMEDLTYGSDELEFRALASGTAHLLGAARANALRPLEPALRGKTVLELGGRLGAVSRYLGEICAQVTVVERDPDMARLAAARCQDLPGVQVVSVEGDQFPSDHRFDVVTLLDPALANHSKGEEVGELLRAAVRWLKPDGLLLLAVDNPLGLRPLAGLQAAAGVEPYAAINGQEGPVALGRQALGEQLTMAGLASWRFYFNFPDHRAATLVITEEGLRANKAVLENLLAPMGRPGSPAAPARFSEGLGYVRAVESGLVGELANSFLVAATPAPRLPAVLAEHVLAYTYSVGRRRNASKEVCLVETDQGMKVRRRLLHGAQKSEWMHYPDEEVLLPGRLLFNALLPLVNTTGWGAGHLVDWLRPLHDALVSQSADGLTLPGEYLDACPFNFIDGIEGESSFFDLEWNCWPTVELDFVLFRGVFHALSRVGTVARPFAGTPLGLPQLTRLVVESLTGRLVQVERYLEMEAEFLRNVSVFAVNPAGFNTSLVCRADTDETLLGKSAQPNTRMPAIASASNGADDRGSATAAWLSKRRLTPRQRALIEQYGHSASNLPTIGIVVLDPDGVASDVSATIRTIFTANQPLENKRAVVLSGGSNLPATAPSDRLHFVSLQADRLVATLNETIAACACDWFMVLRAGEELTVSGLLVATLELMQAPDCRAVYGDTVHWTDSGDIGVALRPSFNLDYLLSFPSAMARHWLFRRSVFIEAGGFDERFAASMEFDYLLRLVESGGSAGLGHIDEPLANVPAPVLRSEATEIAVLERHLKARGYEDARIETPNPGRYRILYGHRAEPLVSIIIPTKNQLPMLQRCVESVLEKTRYQRYEILIVDNNSDEPDAVEWLAAVEALDDEKIKILRYPHPFNYSAINNLAARQARGDYLVLLNNDTAVIDEGWLDNLLNHALRPEVGIVGAKLLYPDGCIQHAGVVLGLRGPAEHPFIGEPMSTAGYMHRLQVDQNYSAVTAACLMIRRSVYDQVGGLDEDVFKVSYNDVDLCLKVGSEGYLIVWTPHAVLLHEGSVSQRNVDTTPIERKSERFIAEQDAMYQKWLPLLARDPAYNRNLALSGKGFELEADVSLNWRPLVWRPLPVVLAHPADAWGCGNYRVIKPFEALQDAGAIEGMLSEGLLQVVALERFEPDVIVLQRQIGDERLEAMRRLKKFSSAFKIYELDDYLPNLPLKSTHRAAMPKDIVKSLRKGLSYVDRFVVSTEALADALDGFHSELVVVKNRLPVGWWKGLKSQRGVGPRPRVGWAGGVGHAGDLELIADVVRELASEVDWVFFGMCPDRIRPYVKEVHPGVEIDRYPAALARLNLDLALAPLEQNLFNDCKSNLRLLEYGACGFPVVCSDSRAYRGDLPVTRVKNRFKDWVDAIRMHLSDPAASAAMGDSLHERITTEWMLDGSNLEEWRAAWTSR